MKTALFTNFTDQDFVGYWDGKPKRFTPGQTLYMPDYLAQHFAKHLANRELLRKDANGNLIYPDGEKMTSPKFPEQVPMFMDLFNKAYIPDESEDLGTDGDPLDALIGAANKNRAERIAKVVATPEKVTAAPPLSQPREPKPQEDQNFKRETSGAGPTGVQEILPPDWNETDEVTS